MSVGATITKLTVDSTSGNVAATLKTSFDRVQAFKTWLDTQLDADLITLGYVQAEVDRLRSAYTDLDLLRQVFQGTATQATLKDFRAFAKLIWGFGLQ